MNRRAQILRDIDVERDRQHSKWGKQEHLFGVGPDQQPLFEIGRQLAVLDGDNLGTAPALEVEAAAKAATDLNAKVGIVTYADILLEEVFEALGSDTPEALRKELVQVAAVAVQWVELIDERGGEL